MKAKGNNRFTPPNAVSKLEKRLNALFAAPVTLPADVEKMGIPSDLVLLPIELAGKPISKDCKRRLARILVEPD